MDIILVVFSVYLALGIIVLAAFDLATKRIRNRLKPASLDTQALTGESFKVAILVTALVLLLLWPVAIFAAVKGWING